MTVMSYRGHEIRERYLEAGLSVWTVSGHGQGIISQGLSSPAACRRAIDFCFSLEAICASRIQEDLAEAAL